MTDLDTDECLALLGSVPVGRIGLSMGALPVVLPVNFAVVDRSIVFRSVEGTKFHAASSGAVVAFEADSYDQGASSGWSVLVQGVGCEVTDPDELERLSTLTIDPWAIDGSADRFVRIDAARVSGRRFCR